MIQKAFIVRDEIMEKLSVQILDGNGIGVHKEMSFYGLPKSGRCIFMD